MMVAAVNDAPIARDDNVGTPVDTAVTIFVLINDSNLEGHQCSITGFDGMSENGGTVTCTTFCQYTPPTGFTDTNTFGYTIMNSEGARSSVMMTISVG